jgi:hypothetical protein
MSNRVDFAGQTVVIKSDLNDPSANVPAGSEYVVEGYWDEITGKSWMYSDGNWACLNYAMRSGAYGLPLDDNVLYGKVGTLGFLVDVSEVESV